MKNNGNFEKAAREVLKHILNLRPIGGSARDVQLAEGDLLLIRETLGYPADGSMDFADETTGALESETGSDQAGG